MCSDTRQRARGRYSPVEEHGWSSLHRTCTHACTCPPGPVENKHGMARSHSAALIPSKKGTSSPANVHAGFATGRRRRLQTNNGGCAKEKKRKKCTAQKTHHDRRRCGPFFASPAFANVGAPGLLTDLHGGFGPAQLGVSTSSQPCWHRT